MDLELISIQIGEGNGNPLQYSCLVGSRLWGRTESDTTEVTQQQQQQHVDSK